MVRMVEKWGVHQMFINVFFILHSRLFFFWRGLLWLPWTCERFYDCHPRKITKRLTTKAVSFARPQYIRNTAVCMNRNGHEHNALTLYAELSWHGTPWVNEQIILISVARFARYFEVEKIIFVFFTHPNVSVGCQPTRNPDSFVTRTLIY